MVDDLFSRIDRDTLYPPFLERVLWVVERCREEGAEYWAISGFRSHQEQAVLYFQGRTTPGPIVTNAKPGDSLHNYGLAVDFCLDGYVHRRGLQPDWRIASYDVLGRWATKAGLEWGGTWKNPDRPHVQLPGIPLAHIKAAHAQGGLKACWQLAADNETTKP